MVFRKIKDKFLQLWHKIKLQKRVGYIGYTLLGVLAVFFLFGFSEPAFAQLTDVANALTHFFTEGMLVIARLCIGFTIFALKFFIEIAKYNNYIDAPTVKLGWLMVRDVANMFFVVALLLISFGTILGVEQYEWKKTLVKLIISAVFINFSNMIAQLFIDIAHVFTITFVNAISATAGGNLINMFNINEIYELTNRNFDSGTEVEIEFFAASAAAFFLALTMAVTMSAYLIIMLARMVVLWVLIIFSPMAYILQVIPHTQDKAKEYWKEFSNYLIAAPMMVFFLWLAFATLSTNNVVKNELNIKMDGDTFDEAEQALNESGVSTNKHQLSISEATTWENMASYLVAIAFLMAGLREVQKLNVEGSGVLPSIKSFATDVAKYATGYSIGRKIMDRGVKRAGEATDAVFDFAAEGLVEKPLMNFPVVGGKSWARTGKRIQELRRNTPGLRRIPFLGKYNEEYQEKLDDRVDKINKMQKDVRMKDMSKTAESGFSAVPVKTTNWAADKLQKLASAGLDKMGTIRGLDKIGLGQLGLDKLGLQHLGIVDGKQKGIIGLGALTARRNYAEYQEMASIQMRSATNKKSREAGNRAKLLKQGRELVLDAEDEMFGEWLATNHSVTGYETLDKEGRQQYRDKYLEGYRNDETEREKLGEKLNGGLNFPKKAMFGLYGADEEKDMRAIRNAATYVYRNEKLKTMEAKNKEEESKARELVLSTAPGQQFTEDQVISEAFAGIADDMVKKIKSVKLGVEMNRAKDELAAAMAKGGGAAAALASQDPFIKSLLTNLEAGNQEDVAEVLKSVLESDVESQFVDPETRGFSTPPTRLEQFLERRAAAVKLLGEVGRGQALSDNFMMLAQMEKNGEFATDEQRFNAYATMFAANETSNTDDGLDQIATKLNTLAIYDKFKNNPEELQKHMAGDQLKYVQENEEALRIMGEKAGELGLVKFDSGTGKWIDDTNVDAVAKFQAYHITGGDSQWTNAAFAIRDIMTEAEDRGKSISYAEAMSEYFNSPKHSGEVEELRAKFGDDGVRIKNQEDFLKYQSQYQHLFQHASENMKVHALGGHYQNGLNIAPDSTFGQLRISTAREQWAMMEGSIGKRLKTSHEPHAVGRYNGAKGRMDQIDSKRLSTTGLGKATTVLEHSKVHKPRTSAANWGVHKRADAAKLQDGEGRAKIGESVKFLKEERGNGDYMVGVYTELAKNIGNTLIGLANPALDLRAFFATKTGRLEAEAGFLAATIASDDEHKIDHFAAGADSTSELASQVFEFLSDGDVKKHVFDTFKEQIKVAESRSQDEKLPEFERVQAANKAKAIKRQRDEVWALINDKTDDKLMENLPKVRDSFKVKEEDFRSRNRRGSNSKPNNNSKPDNNNNNPPQGGGGPSDGGSGGSGAQSSSSGTDDQGSSADDDLSTGTTELLHQVVEGLNALRTSVDKGQNKFVDAANNIANSLGSSLGQSIDKLDLSSLGGQSQQDSARAIGKTEVADMISKIKREIAPVMNSMNIAGKPSDEQEVRILRAISESMKKLARRDGSDSKQKPLPAVIKAEIESKITEIERVISTKQEILRQVSPEERATILSEGDVEDQT